MIIAVEGPSAAGKTTWLKRISQDCLVPEVQVSNDAPDRASNPNEAERYWARKNAERWAEAERIELSGEVAYCDTDPLKLHYVWSLWQIGAASRESWINALELHRNLVKQRLIGFADLVLVSIPDAAKLRANKESDSTRTRRHFELHSALSDPLRRWYTALEDLEPNRVRWTFPLDSDALDRALQSGRREGRYSLVLFDELTQTVDALPPG